MVVDFIAGKLRAGMARVAAERPEGFFSTDTPEVDRAEAELNAAVMAWRKDPRVTTKDVQAKFRAWIAAIDDAAARGKEQKLFA